MKSKIAFNIPPKIWFVLDLLVVCFVCFSLYFSFITIRDSIQIDFEIFHAAGGEILKNNSPYQFYGKFNLPFQYFPWGAWIFAPLALLPIRSAWIIYSVINILMLTFSIIASLKEFSSSSAISPRFFGVVFSTSLIMSLLVFETGQISIFVFLICTLTLILINRRRFFLAGILFPFLILKPQLVLIFIFHLLWEGKSKFAISALCMTMLMSSISFLLNPKWLSEMIGIIISSQSRGGDLMWGFSTLAGGLMLPNWRIANFYIALPSNLIALMLLINIKPALPKSVFALTLSLFAAPYSFAYDLPLLIPAMILISTQNYIIGTIILTTAALLPILFQYQGQVYFLTVLVTFMFFYMFRSTKLKSP